MDNLTFFGLLAGLAISSALCLGCIHLATLVKLWPSRLLLVLVAAWFLLVVYACGAALLGGHV